MTVNATIGHGDDSSCTWRNRLRNAVSSPGLSQRVEERLNNLEAKVLTILRNQEKMMFLLSEKGSARKELANDFNRATIETSGDQELNDQGDITVTEELLDQGLKIRGKCNGIGHFSSLTVKHLFSAEEMKDRNCNDRKGKQGLNATKLSIAKRLTFSLFDVPVSEQEEVWNSKCVKAIDEMLQRSKRKRNQKQPEI